MSQRRQPSASPSRRDHAPSSPSAKAAPERRTDAALQPSSALDARVSRALDQELEWYFTYAEAAMGRADVAMLPSYAAVRVLATEPTDEACRRHALNLALQVRMTLVRLDEPGASVLRAAYMPRRFPERITKTWGPLSGVVVRLWLASHAWPPRWGRSGLEEAAASQLAAVLDAKNGALVARLRAQADDLLRSAIVAYARARALDLGLGVQGAK